jgi:hypothetical protein
MRLRDHFFQVGKHLRWREAVSSASCGTKLRIGFYYGDNLNFRAMLVLS